jgi:hypothetical protein
MRAVRNASRPLFNVLVAALACAAPILAGLAATGADAGAAANPKSPAFFEAQIAPLLARHCLECHDSGAKQGGLDLSRKGAALAGGKAGRAIVPGKAAQSLLWKHVEADRMPPKDRPRLSPQEKRLLRQWLDAGAVWSGDAIEPSARGAGAGSNWVRRLTVPEYVETVRSALGVDVEREARRLLPPDLRADGFTNTAYNLGVDLVHVEAYAELAQIIAGRIDAAAFAAEFTESRELTDANMRRLIGGMGKWLLRGPLESQETDAFLRISQAVAGEGGDFAEAVRYVVEAMVQSPRFIYRIEKQSGDGRPRRVSGHELASRLSYILWGAPPDRELMRAADAGELSNRARVEAQVRRMLEDPRAVEHSTRFIRDWLNLDGLTSLRPNRERFPTWSEQLAADMREETLAFFRHVAWEQKRPLSDLMNAQVTFATPRLAAHYGLKWSQPAGTGKEGLEALYTFEEGRGDTVRDTSGAGEPLDLKIADPGAVKWEGGGLKVNDGTLIASAAPPKRLVEAVRKSKAVTLEAWITPADGRQAGPARILTLSSGSSERNFTLGQEGDRFDVRFRARGTDRNGMPGLASPVGSAGPRPTHLVYTRDAAGKARLYVDGEDRGSRDVGGDLSNWNDGFRLALANETTRDRAWRGTLHTVAIYSRALAPEEIRSAGAAVKRYDLSGVPGRGGLLTQGSVLTVGGDEASMVARGLFVLSDLLFSRVGSPPPGLDTTPVPPKPGLSQRAIAEKRLADPSCGGCHAKFEPLAFGLEKFDGVGAFHEVDEHGNRLREDGEILFPGQGKPAAYRTTVELMDLLAGSERVRMNLTRKVTQFALGRPLAAADTPAVEKVHAAAQKGGGTYEALITAIVMSDLVQMTQTETAR